MKKFFKALGVLLVAVFLAASIAACVGGDEGGDKDAVKLLMPANVRVENDILKWDAVKNAASYDVLVKEREAVRVKDGIEYPLLYLSEPDTYSIAVRAVGDGKNYTDSEYSAYTQYIVSQQGAEFNVELQSITPSTGQLTPSFDPKVLSYTLKVEKDFNINNITVTALAQATDANVKIEYLASSITIEVSSKDGITKNLYQINISFDDEGGKEPEEDIVVTFEIEGTYYDRMVKDGSIQEIDSLPLPLDKIFVGWFTHKTGGEEFDISSTIEKNITVYARFQDTSLIISSNDDNLILNNEQKTLSMAVSSQTEKQYFHAFGGMVRLSAGATMEVFSDNTLTQKIEEHDLTEGENTFYIRVMAGDKTNNTVYTLSIRRNRSLMIEFCSDITTADAKDILTAYCDEGQKLTQPLVDPTKIGHTFGGWYKDIDFENAWDFENDTVNSHTRLYARQTINQYEVTFDVRGGNDIDPLLVAHGSQILATPQREGFSFAGWFDSTLHNRIETITKAQEVYAKWQTDVVFMADDKVHFVQTVLANTRTTAPTQPKKTGVVFGGWTTEKDGSIYFDFDKTDVNRPTTLYASWIEVSSQQSEGFLFTLSPDESEYYVRGDYSSSLRAERIIEIPSSYDGLPVTKILQQGFFDFSTLECVFVPSSIVTIESEAFSGCTVLRQAILSEGLVTIEQHAFYMTMLDAVTIPDSVKSIGDYAFSGINIKIVKLISSTIPSMSILAIDSVCAIIVKKEHYENYVQNLAGYSNRLSSEASFENGMLFSYDKTTALRYFGDETSIAVPSGITSIASYFLDRSRQVKKVIIPASVKSIADTAFITDVDNIEITWHYNEAALFPERFKDNVKHVVITASTINIPSMAFYNGFSNIESVTIQSGVKSVGNVAFGLLQKLMTVTIEDGLESIGESAFDSCILLQKITIPGSVKIIGSYAFADCINLQQAIISDGVETISFYAFRGCVKLSDLTLSNTLGSIKMGAFDGCKSLKTVTLPDSLLSIERSAFAYCTSMREITIPKNVAEVQGGAFMGSRMLKSINVSQQNTSFKSIDGVLFDKLGEKLIAYAPFLFGDYVVASTVKTIGEYAFSKCTGLTSVIIPNSVTAIEANAFSLCTYLKKLTIGSSVAKIGAHAFEGCEKLESAKLPNSVKTVDAYAFAECRVLKTLTIGTGVETIGDYAFYNCKGILAVTIPKNVKTIGVSAFEGCVWLSSVTLENGIESIGAYAFKNTGLVSVVIPDSITTIAHATFFECESLSSVTIGKNVKVIGSYAFYNCTRIQSLSIPDKVTAIGDYAFYSLRSLSNQTLIIPASVESIGDYAFSNANIYEAVLFEGLQSIGEGAFKGSSITKIKPPSSLKSIGSYAFESCNGLAQVTLSEGLESIGEYAFLACGNLTSIQVPNSVIFLDEGAFYNCTALENAKLGSGVLELADKLFYNNQKLSDVTLGGNVTKIGDSVFEQCVALEAFIIPNSVVELGEAVFKMSGLKSITIGSGVVKISKEAFLQCVSLESIEIPNSVEVIGEHAFYMCSSLKSVVIGSGVTDIGSEAFMVCSNIETITLPFTGGGIASGYTNFGYIFGEKEYTHYGVMTSDSLKTVIVTNANGIGEWAFARQGKIEYITIADGTTSIPLNAFYGTSNLKSIIIPEGVKTIEEYAFAYSGVQTVKILEGLESLGENAFAYCASLESIELPKSLITIGDIAFSSCISLKNITGGESVQSLGRAAFSNCQSLETVEFPNVLTIGDYAFSDCPALKSVTVGTKVTSIGEEAFGNCTALESFTIPSSVVSIGRNVFLDSMIDALSVTWHYNSAIGSENFAFYLTSVIVGEGITEIANNAFNECTRLESAILPTTLKTIGDNAFRFCSRLTEIELHDGLLSIGEYAFYGSGLQDVIMPDSVETVKREVFGECKDLISVTLPKDLDIIDVAMFMGCASLTNLTIPSQVTEIGEKAFSGCSALLSVTIPNAVQTIGMLAFQGCSSIESITLPFVGDNADYNTTGYRNFGYLFGIHNIESQYNALPKSLKIVILSGSTVIPHMAFYGCNFITDITLPEGITMIGGRSFYNCEALENINIPSTVNYIDYEVFSGCESLKEIILTQNISHISHLVFDRCKNLVIIVQGLPSTPITWESDWLGTPLVATVQWNA